MSEKQSVEAFFCRGRKRVFSVSDVICIVVGRRKRIINDVATTQRAYTERVIRKRVLFVPTEFSVVFDDRFRIPHGYALIFIAYTRSVFGHVRQISRNMKRQFCRAVQSDRSDKRNIIRKDFRYEVVSVINTDLGGFNVENVSDVFRRRRKR